MVGVPSNGPAGTRGLDLMVCCGSMKLDSPVFVGDRVDLEEVAGRRNESALIGVEQLSHRGRFTGCAYETVDV